MEDLPVCHLLPFKLCKGHHVSAGVASVRWAVPDCAVGNDLKQLFWPWATDHPVAPVFFRAEVGPVGLTPSPAALGGAV